MKTELVSISPAEISTELLVVFAWDATAKAAKKAGEKPSVTLLVDDAKIAAAAAAVRTSGEYGAASCETVLLHAPAGAEGPAAPDRRRVHRPDGSRGPQGRRNRGAI